MLIGAIETSIPTPDRDDKSDPLFFVARTFDVNKPGSAPNKLIGGILGGSVIAGKFKTGERSSGEYGCRRWLAFCGAEFPGADEQCLHRYFTG